MSLMRYTLMMMLPSIIGANYAQGKPLFRSSRKPAYLVSLAVDLVIQMNIFVFQSASFPCRVVHTCSTVGVVPCADPVQTCGAVACVLAPQVCAQATAQARALS